MRACTPAPLAAAPLLPHAPQIPPPKPCPANFESELSSQRSPSARHSPGRLPLASLVSIPYPPPAAEPRVWLRVSSPLSAGARLVTMCPRSNSTWLLSPPDTRTSASPTRCTCD
eukprot:scaffold24093_cov105-Isochrysis_galbana.AAC.4